ncbi:MAG: hypothetical protein JKX73_08330 [Flavobacteriales bacterium]|nr:hypothetical protein [Flavobacteriales bacterium]
MIQAVSDPYDIATLSKGNDQIEIIYRLLNGELNSIIIHSLSGNVHRLGDGMGDHELYILKASKADYSAVKEGCDLMA